jgi:hypothetical protein
VGKTRIVRGFIAVLVTCTLAAVTAACTGITSSACPGGVPTSIDSCSGGSGPPPTPPPINTTFTVPAGDAEPVAAFGTPWDVLSVATSRTGPPGGVYSNITITLTFLQANAFSSLPAPGGNVGGSGTQLGILIEFDADQNGLTGGPGTCNGFTYGTGFDHEIDGSGLLIPRLADGNFAVLPINPQGAMTGEAVVTGSGSQVIIDVPINTLGGTGATSMFVTIINSNGANAVTDCVPDASVIST